MQKNENIVRYTSEELREKRERFGTLTDWDRVRAMTEEELEAAIDEDEEGSFDSYDWDNVIVGFPLPKRQITIRIDGDIIDFFKDQGSGYQTRMNNVLRGYVNEMCLREIRRSRSADSE